MNRIKTLLPLMVLLLALMAPSLAFAAPLAPALANAGAAASNSGLSIDLNGSGLFTDRMVQIVALITVLSIAPSILIMMTSFVRMVVVLSLLRTALGLQQSPPNSVLVSLAMFLTLFVMTPTLTDAYHQGIEPMMNNQVTAEQGFTAAMMPMKKFMLAHVRDADLKLFLDMSHAKPSPKAEDTALTTLVPAFMISEVKTAFQIGFLIYIPFLIIDLVVASTLMSMGMMMLPPAMISLPFKLLLFVLVDGWTLLSQNLVAGFHV
jgi:flagellar biosynthetic protein FliP